MPGESRDDYSIQLEEGNTPCALTVPRHVAIPLLKHVKEELARMIALESDQSSESAN